MQRNTKIFFIGGIAVLVLSLGSIIFTSQLGSTNPDPVEDIDVPSEEAEPKPSEGAGASNDEDVARRYDAPPEMVINEYLEYEAILRLSDGDVRIELFPLEAPLYVNNFVSLSRDQFFDGLTFHRVIPGFVAQTGDPTGSGFGSSGYNLDVETNSILFDVGSVSMARDASGGVNGSQFFITLGHTPHLDEGFTVFGRVIDGLELLHELTPRDPEADGAVIGDRILGIEIIESRS